MLETVTTSTASAPELARGVVTTLLSRAPVAERTMAFRFAKPAGFAFKAGQAIDLILHGTAAAEGEAGSHAFSLVGAPFEPELTIATRMRDSTFKRRLAALPIGALVSIDGPVGSMTLHNDRRRAAVFIAGGIGITPFVSILRQAMHDATAQPMALLYANRRPEDAAFLEELERLQARTSTFRMIATMTGRPATPWAGAQGRIEAALVRRVAAELPAPIFYLAGPPSFVADLERTLSLAGVDDDAIRSEGFYGY